MKYLFCYINSCAFVSISSLFDKVNVKYRKVVVPNAMVENNFLVFGIFCRKKGSVEPEFFSRKDTYGNKYAKCCECNGKSIKM